MKHDDARNVACQVPAQNVVAEKCCLGGSEPLLRKHLKLRLLCRTLVEDR